MKASSIKEMNEGSALIRLTALWALHESAVGGVLHLFKLPFSGIIMAGVAVLLISLITYVATHPAQELVKALTVVLLIKLVMSPHSPVTAYIAVIFQGLTAVFIFKLLPYKIAAFAFAIIALLESAIQKLLTLTILFGMSLWESLDKFTNYVFKMLGLSMNEINAQASIWVIGFYLCVYLMAGIFVGWFAGKIPTKVNQVLPELELPVISTLKEVKQNDRGNKRYSNRKVLLLSIFILLLLIYFFIPESRTILKPFYFIIRVVFILILWYAIISPYLMKGLSSFLNKKESAYSEEVQKAMALIPSFNLLMKHAWKETQNLSGLQRIKTFVIISFSYCLIYDGEEIDD